MNGPGGDKARAGLAINCLVNCKAGDSEWSVAVLQLRRDEMRSGNVMEMDV